MLQAFSNIFKVPELRNKVMFTLFIIFVYRIGSYIPTPGIDGMALAQFFQSISRTPGGTLFGLMGMFSGGALEKATIFALGRLHESTEDTDSARSYYERLIDEYPASGWTNLARSRIITLNLE